MNLQLPPAFSDNEEHYQSTTLINERPSNAPRPTSNKELSTIPSTPLLAEPTPNELPPSSTQISFKTVLLSNGFNKRSRNFAEEPRPEEVTESNTSPDRPQESKPTEPPPTSRQSRRLMIDLTDMSMEQATYLVLGMVIMYIAMNAAALCLSWFMMSEVEGDEDDDKPAKKIESLRESNAPIENYRINPVFVDVEAPREPERPREPTHDSISTIPEEEGDTSISNNDCGDITVGVIEVHAPSDGPPKQRTDSTSASTSGATLITVVPVVTSSHQDRASEAAQDSSSTDPVSTESSGADNEERFREMEIIEGREAGGRRRSSAAVTTEPLLLLASARPAENLPDVVDNVAA